jgi:hypothetical protein
MTFVSEKGKWGMATRNMQILPGENAKICEVVMYVVDS